MQEWGCTECVHKSPMGTDVFRGGEHLLGFGTARNRYYLGSTVAVSQLSYFRIQWGKSVFVKSATCPRATGLLLVYLQKHIGRLSYLRLFWVQLLGVCKEIKPPPPEKNNKASLVLLKTIGKTSLIECFIIAVTSSASSGLGVVLTDRNEMSIDL